jgi:hypothetical protein
MQSIVIPCNPLNFSKLETLSQRVSDSSPRAALFPLQSESFYQVLLPEHQSPEAASTWLPGFANKKYERDFPVMLQRVSRRPRRTMLGISSGELRASKLRHH